MNVNRIIELDACTGREPYLQIRYIARTERPREIQPDASDNLLHDLIILTEALGCIIIEAERQGVCNKGSAMKQVIDNLNQFYVDAEVQVNSFNAQEAYKTSQKDGGIDSNGL